MKRSSPLLIKLLAFISFLQLIACYDIVETEYGYCDPGSHLDIPYKDSRVGDSIIYVDSSGNRIVFQITSIDSSEGYYFTREVRKESFGVYDHNVIPYNQQCTTSIELLGNVISFVDSVQDSSSFGYSRKSDNQYSYYDYRFQCKFWLGSYEEYVELYYFTDSTEYDVNNAHLKVFRDTNIGKKLYDVVLGINVDPSYLYDFPIAISRLYYHDENGIVAFGYYDEYTFVLE